MYRLNRVNSSTSTARESHIGIVNSAQLFYFLDNARSVCILHIECIIRIFRILFLSRGYYNRPGERFIV